MDPRPPLDPSSPRTAARHGRLRWLWQRWQRDEPLRYLVVGAWNTVFGYLVFVVLYALLHASLHYLIIGVVSHAIAMINAFACHRLIVFRSRAPWVIEFVRFNAAQLAVLGGGLALLWVLVQLAHLGPPVAQGIVTLCAVAFGYLAHRHFSFATR